MNKVIDQPAALTTTSMNEDSALDLSSGRLFSKDFVLTLLHDKLGGTLAVILTVLLAGVVFFFDVALPYTSQSVAPSTSLLLEVSTSLRKIFTILLGLSVYLLLPSWIAYLFSSLKRNMVIASPRKEEFQYEDFLHDVVERIDRRIWAICGTIFVGLFWIYRAFRYSGKRPVWLEVGALMVYALAYYAFLITLIKICLALLSTYRLFGSFNIQVNPLHPDGAGGLGAIGRMLSRYVSITVAFALLVAAGRVFSYYAHQRELYLGRSEVWMFLVACAFIPLFLWGWLWVPHKAMVQCRDSKLMGLAEEFLRAIPNKYPSRPIDTAMMKESTDRLAELKRPYELLKETYPTWPISFRQVKSLVAIMSTPFITTLLPYAIDYLLGRK